jgi:hypothetical protein
MPQPSAAPSDRTASVAASLQVTIFIFQLWDVTLCSAALSLEGSRERHLQARRLRPECCYGASRQKPAHRRALAMVSGSSDLSGCPSLSV